MTTAEQHAWHCTVVVSSRHICPSAVLGDLMLPLLAVFGPAATLWFGFLQRRIVIPKRPNLEIFSKVMLDQCVFASTNLFVFLNSMALMEGTDPKKKLESTYFSALSRNWMLWPPVQAINFKYVPLDYRVLVVNVVALGEQLWGMSLTRLYGN